MGKFIVEGKRPLQGTIRINGAKNSALKLMVAALLGQGKFVIDDVPHIADVFTMCEVLKALGVQAKLESNQLQLNVTSLLGGVPKELAQSMRASVQILGPLVAKLGRGEVARPGGCAIGTRSLDLHLSGLAKMGAKIEVHDDLYVATADKLVGADISFRYPSVGATENIMMAAVLARGTTTIRNAAREPEIVDIQRFLNAMGGKVEGAGTSTITIKGVADLGSTNFRVIPDRIEAGTYLLSFLITQGSGILQNVRPPHLASLIEVTRKMGASVEICGNSLIIDSTGSYSPFAVSTNPYPAFPTDLQPQLVALGTQAMGSSTMTEAVFDQRFGYVSELVKLGADIKVQKNQALVTGPTKLTGNALVAQDLRAGAALVLGALAAEGQTTIVGVEHIDRGYEQMEEKLRQVGAKISRLP